jgi:hypothetical protein|tara:strand:- start:849 stop:2840 length:1992 start_codon:yes stop_codon:yes gene_type:complete
MNQVGTIQNAHNSAMNTLMSKYQDTLMLADAAKRKKDELLDSAGMELIQAGLGSGRLHKLGHHLAGRVIGKRALKHTAGAIREAVGAYQKRGRLSDVVRHFATKKGGLGARALERADPTGRIARLHADIRNKFGSAEEAIRVLGAQHESTVKEAYETARAGPQSALNAGRDKANQLTQDATDKANKIAQDATDKANKLAQDAKDKAKKLGQDAEDKANALQKSARAKAKSVKARADQAVDDAQDSMGGAVEGAKEKARRVKAEAEAGVAKAQGVVKEATGAGTTVLETSAIGAQEKALKIRATTTQRIQDERGSLAQKRARIVAQREQDAKDLKANLLKERQDSLKRKPVAQPEAEAEAQPEAQPEAKPKAQPAQPAQPAPAQEKPAPARVPSPPDTTASSVKRSTGLGGFLNSPEEEAKLQRQQPKAPVEVAYGKADPFSRKPPPRKPRPSYRNRALRRRPQAGETGYIDPVQARMAKHAEVSRNLASAKANLEASQATTEVQNRTSKTSSWAVRRPIKNGRQERAQPTTIRNEALDSQEARSVNTTIPERPAGYQLPDFETASKQVARAPQSLIQAIQRRVRGTTGPPQRASTAFAPESALIQRARARNKYSSQATQGEADDRPVEEEEYTPSVEPEHNFSFANFGFGGGDMEGSTVIGEI